jgi:hypothetical protein
MSNFDANLTSDANPMETSSIDANHQRLLFSAPIVSPPILDHAFRPTAIQLTAQLHGMFFLAESSLPVSGENPILHAPPPPPPPPPSHAVASSTPPTPPAPPTELTCYRRNLFQVTGNLVVPRGLGYFLSESGEQIPIIGQELAISATETVEQHAVKIICVPWKTPITSAPSPEDKLEREPAPIAVDLAASDQELDPDFVTIPVAWKRLQFRIATANNGRRKELQQHFVVHLKVIATLATGQKVNLHEVVSGAIVVRGRSPRNFQSKKDLPISGSGAFGRRREQVTRTSTGDSNPMPPRADRLSPHSLSVPQVPFSFDSKDLAMPSELMWDVPGNHAEAMTALPSDFVFEHGGTGNVYAQSTPDLTRTMNPARPAIRAPINLTLADGDDVRPGARNLAPLRLNRHRKTSSASPMPPTPLKKPRIHNSSARSPSFSLGHVNSTDESADGLYEYFPIGLDDWMPPVDAVYRPHVVHHTNLPADPKTIKNRSKRYFSEDQVV